VKFIFVFLLVSLAVGFCYAQVYELSGYILRGSFGQSTIGKTSSANYIAYIGFWHPYPAGPGIEEDLFLRWSIPIVFSLSQNYPNPVTRSTTIKYGMPQETEVDIRVFNSAGQQVRTLISESQEPGYYKVKWDLRGVSGEHLPNGVYFYRIRAGSFISARKMVILR